MLVIKQRFSKKKNCFAMAADDKDFCWRRGIAENEMMGVLYRGGEKAGEVDRRGENEGIMSGA